VIRTMTQEHDAICSLICIWGNQRLISIREQEGNTVHALIINAVELDNERWTHIAVDVAATKNHDAVHVLYVATLSGAIRKYTLLPRSHDACLVEIIEPLPHQRHPTAVARINTMQFLKPQVFSCPWPSVFSSLID